MTALAGNFVPQSWLHGSPMGHPSRRPGLQQLAIGKKLWLGAVAMAVDGIARPVVSGTDMLALCLKVDGADANGGVYFRARDASVRVIVSGGTSKTLGVTKVDYGATTDVWLQLGTDNAAAVTSTALEACAAIRAHAEANRLLACKHQGTGAGLAGTTSAAAVPHIAMLGVTQQVLDNADGAAVLQLLPSHEFKIGVYGMLGSATVNGIAWILDDQTVTGTDDPIAFRVPVRASDRGLIFCDLAEAQ